MKSVYLEVTQQCNLRCPHCYNMSGSKNSEMRLDEFKTLIHDLVGEDETHEICNLAISGGEALMHKDIQKMLREAMKYPEIRVTVLTNGLLIPAIMDEFLLGPNPISIQVSLDGASIQTNDAVRGKGHFTKVMKVLEELAERGYRRCSLKMTINQLNYIEIVDFIRLSVKFKCIPKFGFLIKEGNALENWNQLELSTSKKVAALNTMKKALKEMKNEIEEIDSSVDILELMPAVVKRCPLLDEDAAYSVAIKANGDVQPCQGLYDEFFTIGNIKERSINGILDVRKNDRLIALKSFLSARVSMLHEAKCRDCIIQDKCSTGCLAQAMSMSNSLLELDEFCSFRRSQFFKNLVMKSGGKKA